jgi:hypothetical protein
MIYDFGAVAVIYSLPITVRLRTCSFSARSFTTTKRCSQIRGCGRKLLKTIGDVAMQPHHASVVEDYVIFHVESLNDC